MSRTGLITLIASIVLLSPAFVASGKASACTVLDKVSAHLGVDQGFRGKCSNNGAPITCVVEDGDWLECSGPAGTFRGTDLDGLIFSACGCHAQEERQKEMEKELGVY